MNCPVCHRPGEGDQEVLGCDTNAEQSQRGSNPCLHPERTGWHVQGMSSSDVCPIRVGQSVRFVLSVATCIGEAMDKWMDIFATSTGQTRDDVPSAVSPSRPQRKPREGQGNLSPTRRAVVHSDRCEVGPSDSRVRVSRSKVSLRHGASLCIWASVSTGERTVFRCGSNQWDAVG
jgi:hypothetical protein